MYRFILCLWFCFICAYASAAEQRQIYGVYEWIQIDASIELRMKAKLDTGALTSSLGADNISFFEKDGEDWVRFTPQVDGAEQMELPIARMSLIKRRMNHSDNESTTQKRPVVMLDVCFNGRYYPLEVNLANRDNFIYPFLLGRKALTQMHAVVDPAAKYTFESACE